MREVKYMREHDNQIAPLEKKLFCCEYTHSPKLYRRVFLFKELVTYACYKFPNIHLTSNSVYRQTTNIALPFEQVCKIGKRLGISLNSPYLYVVDTNLGALVPPESKGNIEALCEELYNQETLYRPIYLEMIRKQEEEKDRENERNLEGLKKRYFCDEG